MEQQSDLEVFGVSELFRGAPDVAIAEALSAGTRRQVAAGRALFQQGDPASALFMVLTGRLRAAQTTPDGQQIIIRYIGPGDIAGYTALAGGEAHPGAVTATDDCALIGWTGAAMRDLMSRHPAIALNAVSLLGARYHEMQIRLRELTTENVERRIGHTLLRLARQAGRRSARGIEIVFPLSRQDLAEMAGTTLHTVSRTLSAWEDRGMVDCGRRRVILCQPAAIEAIADEED